MSLRCFHSFLSSKRSRIFSVHHGLRYRHLGQVLTRLTANDFFPFDFLFFSFFTIQKTFDIYLELHEISRASRVYFLTRLSQSRVKITCADSPLLSDLHVNTDGGKRFYCFFCEYIFITSFYPGRRRIYWNLGKGVRIKNGQ